MKYAVLLLVVATVVLVIVMRRRRPAVARARDAEADLSLVRRVLAEDVDALGAGLDEFGRAHPASLDDETLTDLRVARESHVAAEVALPGLRTPDDFTTEVEALNEGRFRLATASARADGRPLPSRRTPCFFDPQHGPADEDILWNQPGRGTQRVPACADDVARKEAGERLEVRQVRVGDETMPYWQAGAQLAPYVQGTFGSARDLRLDATAVYLAPFDVPLPNADDQFRKWSP